MKCVSKQPWVLQIDYYEELYLKTCKLEDFRVFNGWLRVDIKFFKVSLLNTIKKWSWLFKEHLLTYVTNRYNIVWFDSRIQCKL